MIVIEHITQRNKKNKKSPIILPNPIGGPRGGMGPLHPGGGGLMPGGGPGGGPWWPGGGGP